MPIFETIQTRGIPIKVFADQLDEKARGQLIDLAESGLAKEFIAAMPDVHYGLGATIGSVFASDWAVVPNAVGVDIGCGMAAVPLPGLKGSDLNNEAKWDLHRLIKQSIPTGTSVHNSDQWAPVMDDQGRTKWMTSQLNGRAFRSLGTLGGGNHFIEIVNDPDDHVWIMLHSGSRNLGKITADRYNDLAKKMMGERGETPRNRDLNYLVIDSQEGRDYLMDMTWCQKFASANRQSMLEILGRIASESTGFAPDWDAMVNIHHNFCALEKCGYINSQGQWVEEELWITRKGATSARAGQKGLIPGSMAVGSWLVEGTGNWESWYSCSHGAGRTKSRTASFSQISQQSFVEAMAGIIAETVPELRDEAPQAYKDLNGVMECQKDLVIPKLRLKPIINVKGWDPAGGRKAQAWSPDKLPVLWEMNPDLELSPEWVEAHVTSEGKSSKSDKAQSAWVLVSDFKLRTSSSREGQAREFWIKTQGQSDTKFLVSGCITKVEQSSITLRIDTVRKKEKLI